MCRNSTFSPPRFIAICGNPSAGKTLAQDILLQNYGVEIVDDGEILRDIAIRHFGAKPTDVFTHSGKASLAYWPNGNPITDHRTGEHLTWRRLLGLLGNQLEAMFGPHIMPMTAVARIGDREGSFSFGSVRRDQGRFYLSQGGIVIGISNPLAGPSGNEFDEFDESAVTYWIENDGLARGLDPLEARKDLEDKIHRVLLSRSLAS